jgi:predicted amidohydrolase
MEDWLRIGIIQTTLDHNLAWDPTRGTQATMHRHEANRVWDEIKGAFSTMKAEADDNAPHIVVLPELSIPRHREFNLSGIAKKTGSVVIAGLDFIEETDGIKNRAVVLVPNKWPTRAKSYGVEKIYFGKRFFSNEEQDYFNSKAKEGKSTPHIHLLDAGKFGRVGVAICADFFDIERFAIYKGKIHHMVIIAYNKDVSSFFFLAEAISRLVYCNVIVCNTGYYGGSVVFSPYEKSFRRNIFKLEGQNIYNAQIVSLPVKSLDDARNGKKPSVFKSPPPGYKEVMIP